MPRITDRIIYDDDGEPMKEGSLVLVNGKYKRIIHFNAEGEIDLADFNWEDVETIERIPDDRFGDLEDNVING
jgi:hypothetical protein